ncbi:germ cell-less protein-like 2 [Arvicola amphibius]|uniref:germ cell-less protein-like 2 n=1 Tax=Arvicola amphibius TaxID=1047088 RepID=UPI0018E2D0AC|nr:germ cell-less protein-like 2 [Arvicola amphibius]XP_038173098.1 germ cell-less protein-like 2 [Arvicola amphibius]
MGLVNSLSSLRCSDSSLGEPAPPPEEKAGPSYISGSRKRKGGLWDCVASTPNIHGSWNQAVNLQQLFGNIYRKKPKLSSKYAYQTLFLDGKDCDIRIRALEVEWPLHKAFLCQSAFFAKILKGTWKESHSNVVDLQIKNEDIDVGSLHYVFGSLYRDEDLPIIPRRVPHVLAAACLLQVEHVIRQCKETMNNNITRETVCSYYMAAETYGLKSVKTRCFDWLLCHLMTHPSVELYREIDTKLMYLLVSSPDLLVMRNEMDIYTTLKEWIFLCYNPSWKGSVKQILPNANSWLSKHMKCLDNISFLESEEGLIYQPVFKKLRFQHIICDLSDTATLERDRLIPLEWLTPIYKQQWLALLQEQENREIGPRIISEEFEDCGMRFGTMISRDGSYSWKWRAFRFCFPLHITFTNRCIVFRQCTLRCNGCCLKHVRNVVFKITLVCFDSNGKVTFSKTTGHKMVTFEYKERKIVMKLDRIALNFPLYIFFNFLFLSPGNTEHM